MNLHQIRWNKGIALLFFALLLFVAPGKGIGQESVLLRHRESGKIVELKKGMSVKVKYYNSRGKRRVVMGTLTKITADSLTVVPLFVRRRTIEMSAVRSIRYDSSEKILTGWILFFTGISLAIPVSLLIYVIVVLSPLPAPSNLMAILFMCAVLVVMGIILIPRLYKVDKPTTKWEIIEPIPSSPPGSIPIP